MAAAGAEVVGIDLAERLVEIAAERAHGAGLSDRRDVRRGQRASGSAGRNAARRPLGRAERSPVTV
ncbi:MAG: hypothetical protein M3P40_02965 [Actinomycetota bacterium]|nr:hypothetical protein [Actinomycetota bacterium]